MDTNRYSFPGLDVHSWDDIAKGERLPAEPLAGAVGVFDGVHLGHRALISNVVASGFKPAAITFVSNPKAARKPESWHGDLLSPERKIELLASYGIKTVILIDFSPDFGRMTGREFLSFLRENGSIRYLAAGHDFRCGFRLDTDAFAIRELGAELGFRTDIVDAVHYNGHPVSSSRIRRDIAAGRLDHARTMLDRPHELDFRRIPFRAEGDSLVLERAGVCQTLPPCGTYPVRTAGGKEASLEIGEGSLILSPGSGGNPDMTYFVP